VPGFRTATVEEIGLMLMSVAFLSIDGTISALPKFFKDTRDHCHDIFPLRFEGYFNQVLMFLDLLCGLMVSVHS
jgi:hypothetical protein